MDELPIGRRVAYWRNRRKMSQQVFADRLSKSKSWVDKVERGVRRLDKFSVVYEIAEVLKVDVQILLGKDPERRPENPNGVDRVEVEEIRAALERYDQISAFCSAPAEPPPLSEMGKAVAHAWLSFQHAKYGTLGRSLPRLLREAQAADTAYGDGPHAREAAHVLGQVYQISSAVLRKLGEHELSWIAADRSLTVSQRAGDQLLAGVATTRVSMAMYSLGRVRPALEVTINLANRLAPGTNGSDSSPERLSVYGLLLLQAALAAARLGDSATARDLLGGAEEAALALNGDHNYYRTSFGPTNVQLYRAAVALQLGEGRTAVGVHERLDLGGFNALLPERRAQHFLTQARARVLIGDIDVAGEMLLEADRHAPSEVRCRPIAREMLTDVLRRSQGTPPASVAELARHLSVGV
ncbi:helix-turn-helix domain-containing protein [Dactylosporangium sp. AC04546]|uniref:helix-turn-helix domain-containing protein n=1 Tax=Dactylosporangium sp. AC04546 TaxID=2862460 RepID=UPI001EDD2657|nr:helix-turn-helix domain-containing protein [Dactylosporangium sp. AC04546]WVK80708.1 helix-turn-helix domain-containing protein [Dactylosporangium sp. AC04546]